MKSEGGENENGEAEKTDLKKGSIEIEEKKATPSLSKMGKRVVAGRYHPGKELGKGAFSKVYSAVDSMTGSLVAVKKVETGALSARDLERIRQELCLLKRLIHPNIVSLIDFEETSKNFNFVLEFIEGGSLHEIKTKFGNITEPLLSFYMRQTLKGLHHLHSFNIVHRDIKGANILCTKSGECKLADFGSCSESLREDRKMTMIGTPYWMAPELISQTGGGPASDIWSLGCTILELFTGHPPYWKLNPNLALLRMVEDAHPPLPESTLSLHDFLLNCFLNDYKMRYTAQELLQHDWITIHRSFGTQTPRHFSTRSKLRSKTPPPPIVGIPKTPKRDLKKSKKLGFGKKKEKYRNNPLETHSDDPLPIFREDEGSSSSTSSSSKPGNGGNGRSNQLPVVSIVSPPGSPQSSSSSGLTPNCTLPLTPSSPASFPSQGSEPLEVENRPSDDTDEGGDEKIESKSVAGGGGKGSEPSLVLPQIELGLESEIEALKEDIDEWEKKLYELLQERADLENQNEELRGETELLMKKKETLEAKRDYLKDLITRRERSADLLDVDFASILDRFQKELAHTQREIEMSHVPKMSSVCWMGPGAICQCRDSGTHKWDAAVITGNEVSGSELFFNVIFLTTGEKDQVRASDLQPPQGSEESRRKKKTFFSSSKKREKTKQH